MSAHPSHNSSSNIRSIPSKITISHNTISLQSDLDHKGHLENDHSDNMRSETSSVTPTEDYCSEDVFGSNIKSSHLKTRPFEHYDSSQVTPSVAPANSESEHSVDLLQHKKLASSPVSASRKRHATSLAGGNVESSVVSSVVLIPSEPHKDNYFLRANHPETPLTPAIGGMEGLQQQHREEFSHGKDLEFMRESRENFLEEGNDQYGHFAAASINTTSQSTRTSRASSMDSNASEMSYTTSASTQYQHHYNYSTESSSSAYTIPSSMGNSSSSTTPPSLKLHLSSIFASYTNTLHGSLTIHNSSHNVSSHSVTSPLTLGQNLYASSASYYDTKRLPREIWKVEYILSQIEGYLRLHDRWVCPKQKFLEATLGIHAAQHAAYIHHSRTKNRLVKLLSSTDNMQRRQVTLQDSEQNTQNYIASSSVSIKESNRIVLFQSPVCELYRGGEIILQHETANLPFSVYIPANLPPEYLSGQLIKFRYVLRLKVVLFNSHHGRKEVELELPFKVTNAAASLARISCRHILSGTSFMPDDVFQWTLYKDWNSVVGGRRWKLESLDRLSSSDTNRFSTQTRYIFESIRRHVQSKQGKTHFDIQTKSQLHVCRFTISSTAFQIGDSIFGYFDFARKESRACRRITCRLLSEEIIHEKYLNSPNTKLDASITQKAHAHFVQHVSSLRSYPIYFTIPAQIQPQFKTDVIDLTWHLSFEFLLEKNEKLTWKLPIEIFNLMSNSEQSVSNRSEVSKVIDL